MIRLMQLSLVQAGCSISLVADTTREGDGDDETY